MVVKLCSSTSPLLTRSISTSRSIGSSLRYIVPTISYRPTNSMIGQYQHNSKNIIIPNYRSLSTHVGNSSNGIGARPPLPPNNFPPTHFQDQSNIPLPYDQLSKQQPHLHSHIQSQDHVGQEQQQSQVQQSILNPEYQFTIKELLSNPQTRAATIRLVFFMFCINLITLYNYYESEEENTQLQDEVVHVWEGYDQKDISQTVMAVHIGMLKKQLMDVGLVPVPSSKAIEMSKSLLSFDRRDDNGQLLIFVDQKSPMYSLIPFHSEYNVSQIPQFKDI
ncbi:unnamed protein product [Ambrosiozyma monospora]|uniref:Unnamed protein product n=1 Tax=Ambrosiozyma monospora TaxID=43982 RepID=A0A9W7DEP3_AMBMO|nr:unnamed protein product [Ambrosiozyma monospora]